MRTWNSLSKPNKVRLSLPSTRISWNSILDSCLVKDPYQTILSLKWMLGTMLKRRKRWSIEDLPSNRVPFSRAPTSWKAWQNIKILSPASLKLKDRALKQRIWWLSKTCHRWRPTLKLLMKISSILTHPSTQLASKSTWKTSKPIRGVHRTSSPCRIKTISKMKNIRLLTCNNRSCMNSNRPTVLLKTRTRMLKRSQSHTRVRISSRPRNSMN